MRISDWSSDVCSSDLPIIGERWTGAAGMPTLFNGKPCRTRACASLSSALLATISPYLFEDHERTGFERLMHSTASLALGGDCYRSDEHTSELQSLMRTLYSVFCFKKNIAHTTQH